MARTALRLANSHAEKEGHQKKATKKSKKKKPATGPTRSTRARGRPRKSSTDPRGRYTPKNAAFVSHYLANGMDGKQAALDSGYSAKSAAAIASQLLNKPIIRHEIEKRLRQSAKRADVTPERIMGELAHIGFSRLTAIADWNGDTIQLKDSTTLPDGAVASIAGIENTKHGVKVRLRDSKGALELLGKHLGMFKEQPVATVEIQISQAAEDFDHKITTMARRMLASDTGERNET